MKQLTIIAIACSALFFSCKKSSSTTTTPGTTTTAIPTDGWQLGSTKYKQMYCLRQDNQKLLNCVDATSKPINSFAVFFKAYPTASGTYHVVAVVADSAMKYPGEKIGAGDVIVCGSVATGGSSDKSYWSTGVEHKDVTVTVTGGKIKIEVPEVAVASGTDTMKITGTMIEN